MDENSYQFFDNACVLYIISGFDGRKRTRYEKKTEKKIKETKPSKILLKIFARLSVTRSHFKIYVITEFGWMRLSPVLCISNYIFSIE